MVFAALPALAEIGAGVGVGLGATGAATGVGIGAATAAGTTGAATATGATALGSGGLATGAGMGAGGSALGGTSGMYAPNLSMGSMAPALSSEMPSTMSLAQSTLSPGGMSGATNEGLMSQQKGQMLKNGGKAMAGLFGGQNRLPAPQIAQRNMTQFTPFEFSPANYQFRRPIGF